MEKTNLSSIDEYISGCPESIQSVLEQLRATIKEAAPEAEEKISYQLPTFTLVGNLVHFGAFKNHIGLYPGPGVIAAFKEDLSDYPVSKGTVQFPNSKPLPFELIAKMVKFCVQQNLERANRKKRST